MHSIQGKKNHVGREKRGGRKETSPAGGEVLHKKKAGKVSGQFFWGGGVTRKCLQTTGGLAGSVHDPVNRRERGGKNEPAILFASRADAGYHRR